MNEIGVRHLRLEDLDQVVRLERELNLFSFHVPFIGQCEALQPWAWTLTDYLAAIRQYRQKDRGTYEARVFVAGTTEQLLAAIVVEIQDDGFEIRRLSAVTDQVRDALVAKVLAMAAASRKWRRVTSVVSDGDCANLAYFVRLGWNRQLIRDHFFDGRDAWFLETYVPAAERAATSS